MRSSFLFQSCRPRDPSGNPVTYDFNVFSARKHIEKLRYIHRNPVKRGLVAEPMHWRWSSFRHYVTGERGTVEIESFWTAAVREKEYENCKRL